MVKMLLEPIAAGVVVSILNRLIINNNWLWEKLLCQAETTEDHEDCASSTTSVTSATSDAVHHH